ncbi:MAG: DNA repair protein RecO [Myxococcota bacterium]|jgi:DNA repair protein RecO (recombination protein O)|nr:DNA repair protein RecO [Myxococcota bacterium]
MTVGFSTRALVLRARPLGESDVLAWLLTKEYGTIRAVAKGGRTSRKRFRGALEPFALLDASLENGRGELLRLSETTLLDPHLGLAMDLARLEAATRLLRLLLRGASEESCGNALFEAASSAVSRLAEPGQTAVRAVELWARLAVLRAFGLEVSLERCVGCGANVPTQRKVFFHPVRGGVVCTPCGGGPLLLRAEAASLFVESSHRCVDIAAAQDLDTDHRALDDFEQWHVVRRGKDGQTGA